MNTYNNTMTKTQLKYEIRRLAREKNAIVMAHYYVDGEVQDIADFIGDSLALAQQAARTEAKIIAPWLKAVRLMLSANLSRLIPVTLWSATSTPPLLPRL